METKVAQGNCDACYYRHSSPLLSASSSIVHRVRLTNDHLAIFWEIVLRYLEVERSGALSYATRDIVVRTVARAEPAAKVSSLTNRNTAEMGADTCLALAHWCLYGLDSGMRTKHNQPFGLLDTVRIGLGVTERLPLCVLSLLDLILGAVSDENWLASPLDDDLSPTSVWLCSAP